MCFIYFHLVLRVVGSRFESDLDPFTDDESDEECEEIMESTNPVCVHLLCNVLSSLLHFHYTLYVKDLHM